MKITTIIIITRSNWSRDAMTSAQDSKKIPWFMIPRFLDKCWSIQSSICFQELLSLRPILSLASPTSWLGRIFICFVTIVMILVFLGNQTLVTTTAAVMGAIMPARCSLRTPCSPGSGSICTEDIASRNFFLCQISHCSDHPLCVTNINPPRLSFSSSALFTPLKYLI